MNEDFVSSESQKYSTKTKPLDRKVQGVLLNYRMIIKPIRSPLTKTSALLRFPKHFRQLSKVGVCTPEIMPFSSLRVPKR